MNIVISPDKLTKVIAMAVYESVKDDRVKPWPAKEILDRAYDMAQVLVDELSKSNQIIVDE